MSIQYTHTPEGIVTIDLTGKLHETFAPVDVDQALAWASEA